MKRSRLLKGFTLLEALIVILIVGILAAVGIYGLSITRAMNRDAKRVSDVSVIRAAMTQYWLQKAAYPSAEPVDLGRPGAGAEKLGDTGIVAVDQQPTNVLLASFPTGPNANEYYRYHGSTNGYSLKFTTERATAYGPAGTWYAHAGGVDKEDAEK